MVQEGFARFTRKAPVVFDTTAIIAMAAMMMMMVIAMAMAMVVMILMAMLRAMLEVTAMVVFVVDSAGSSLSRLQWSPSPPPDLQLPVGHHDITVARQGVTLDISYTAKTTTK